MVFCRRGQGSLALAQLRSFRDARTRAVVTRRDAVGDVRDSDVYFDVFRCILTYLGEYSNVLNTYIYVYLDLFRCI